MFSCRGPFFLACPHIIFKLASAWFHINMYVLFIFLQVNQFTTACFNAMFFTSVIRLLEDTSSSFTLKVLSHTQIHSFLSYTKNSRAWKNTIVGCFLFEWWKWDTHTEPSHRDAELSDHLLKFMQFFCFWVVVGYFQYALFTVCKI